MIRADPRSILAAVAIAVAVAWSAFLAHIHLVGRATDLDRLESSLVDMRILAFGRRTPPTGVAIVAIDDETVRRSGSFPIPRSQLGTAVSRLIEGGAAVVVLDLLLLTPSKDEDDRALATELAAGRTAVAAFVDFAPTSFGSVPAERPAPCERPLEAMRQAARDGLVNVALDASGVARHIPLVLPCADGVLPALSLQGASLAADAVPLFEPDAVLVGAVAAPLDINRTLALHYYGPEGTIATIGLAALLDGRLAADFIRGKTIVIGATAKGVGDRYPTPFDSLLPGVEIIATGIANLQSGDALDRSAHVRRIDAAAIMLLGLAVTGGCLAPNITAGLALSGLLCAIWLGGVLIGFAHGIWFAMAAPLAAAGPLGLLAGVGRLRIDRWSEQRLRHQQAMLGAFQPPVMLARMLADPRFLVEPVERRVSVLFLDLSGYTALSERLDVRATRDLLKQWHEIVAAGVAETGGIVANFMADGAMIVWGMVEERPDDARRAVETASRLAERTLHWLETIEAQTGPLGLKVGGHYGPAVLSRLGDATHQHITATGDTINVASRLMAIASARGVTLALSTALLDEAERQGLATADRDFAPAERMSIQGRQQPLAVRINRRSEGGQV